MVNGQVVSVAPPPTSRSDCVCLWVYVCAKPDPVSSICCPTLRRQDLRLRWQPPVLTAPAACFVPGPQVAQYEVNLSPPHSMWIDLDNKMRFLR
jgi:hypothetical protein